MPSLYKIGAEKGAKRYDEREISNFTFFMLLFLDIETTGLDSDNGEILEIAAIRFDGENTHEIFETLLHVPEGIEIPSFITTLTGITNEMCANFGVSLSEAQEKWETFVRPDDVIVGHNISFDTGFLRAKGFFINHQEIDTFVLSSLLLRNEESHSLEVLTEKYGLFHENAHRAKSDVLANIELWKFLISVWNSFLHTKNSESLCHQIEKILQRSSISEKLFFTMPPFHFPQMDAVISRTAREIFQFPEILSPLSSELEHVWESENHLTIWDIVGSSLRMQEICTSALQHHKTVYCVYPDSLFLRYIDYFHAFSPLFPNVFFISPAGKNIEKEKLKTLWDSPSFTKAEAIVAIKTLLADFQDDLLSLSFRGEEWPVVRSFISSPSQEPFSMEGLTFLPISEFYRIPKESLVLMFHAGTLEETLSDTFQVQCFSKRIEEDSFLLNIPSFDEEWKQWSIVFGKSLREKFGKNEYPIKTKWQTEEMKNDEKLSTSLQCFSDLFQKFPEVFKTPPFLHVSHFFFPPEEENMLRMIQLFPDDSWSCISIPIDLSPYFSNILNRGKQFLLLGNGYPKDEKGNILFSFLPSNTKFFEFPKPESYFQNKKIVVFKGVPTDSTPFHWQPILTELFTRHERVLVSVNSKKIAKQFSEELSQWAFEEKIQLVSSESGSFGKIRSFLGKIGKKLCIAPVRTLEEVRPEEFGFTALIILKFIFDPPKDPLLSLRRKYCINDFEEFAVPRARARFETEIFRLFRPDHSVEILFGDHRLSDKNSFGSRFAKVLPAGVSVVRE